MSQEKHSLMIKVNWLKQRGIIELQYMEEHTLNKSEMPHSIFGFPISLLLLLH